MSAFGRVLRELDASGGGYVLVGGVAVVLHGYARLTADIDLVVDLRPGEAVRAIPVASIQDLIAMKTLAGRSKDLEDIAALEAIERSRGR